jgi:hypothetical protein
MTDTTVTAGTEEVTQGTQPPAEGTTTNATTTTGADTKATSGTQSTAEAVVAATWRDDWRQAMAKGDVKELERLQRIPSPESLFDSYRSLEKKMSGMKVPPTLPENPNESQLAEYRRNAGIPEKPEGYYEKLPQGLVIGEEDKPAMDMLAQALHAKNASPDLVATVVDTYYKIIEKNQEEMVAYQRALKQETSDALRAELGADYRASMNSVNALMDGVDKDTRDLLEGMQLADGSLAFNHLGFMRWMTGLATQINPAALVMPGQNGGDKMDTIKQQITANLGEMKKNINAWQSPANASRREEHIRLLQAAEKLGVKY